MASKNQEKKFPDNGWTRIGSGGLGKAHYSAYIKRLTSEKKMITVGRIVYRASLLRFAEVYIYSAGEAQVSVDAMGRLLVNNMSFSGKPFEVIKKLTIEEHSYDVLIKGLLTSLFSKSILKGIDAKREDFDVDCIKKLSCNRR